MRGLLASRRGPLYRPSSLQASAGAQHPCAISAFRPLAVPTTSSPSGPAPPLLAPPRFPPLRALPLRACAAATSAPGMATPAGGNFRRRGSAAAPGSASVLRGIVVRQQHGITVRSCCTPAVTTIATPRAVSVRCMPTGAAGGDAGSMKPTFAGRRQRRTRRSPKSDSLAPAPSGDAGAGGTATGAASAGPAPSPVSSPVPPPMPGSGSGGGASSGGGGSLVAAAASAGTATVTVTATSTAPGSPTSSVDSGNESDYESGLPGSPLGGNHIVPFARRQPRALVLDCAYRPINVLTWYRAFHFDYFGKGEVLEYYPPPAVCTTGSGEYPLPAVIRVPQYTADMQDLCSRVACSRRNVMVRDGFCCQYCGSRRDLTIDHVHPVSRGGKETWDNLVTACMKCNQRKSDRTLRELGWKLRRQPKEPSPFEIGIVAGINTSDILRPPPEWEAYIGPYRERLEMYRRAAVEAGLLNLIDDG